MLEHLAAALKRIGFAAVFDTGFAADLTIMEEATELVKRVQERRRAAHVHQLLPGLGATTWSCTGPTSSPTCPPASRRSRWPGALIKEIYPKFAGLDDKRLVIVSLMPCTAKKYEAQDLGDVDYVLTTRELAALWEPLRHRLRRPSKSGPRSIPPSPRPPARPACSAAPAA